MARRSVTQAARNVDVCLELEDNSTYTKSAIRFFALSSLRDAPQAASLARQFIDQNRSLARILGVQLDLAYDGRDVTLVIHSTNAIGAIPLISPVSARSDFGLVVQPRFPWPGLGQMLASMGWCVTPSPLKLPLLHRSERRVPRWVLSSMLLLRLKTLLESLERRFELVNETRPAPRGAVDWTRYATSQLPRAQVLSVPCSFPDLRDDRLLKGAIRHALELQIHDLETQKHHGAFVHRLIELAIALHRQVRAAPVYIPPPVLLSSWMQRPLRSAAFLEGITALEWTIEERGLAGLSDLAGVPWVMPMDRFFEAWVESVLTLVAHKTGAQVRVGRKNQTARAIEWKPRYLGSQRSLIPDIWLESDRYTLIVDAKYKRHFEELHRKDWLNLEEQTREHHRHDLLQVLAYANLARTDRVIVCLAFPCSKVTWDSLKSRDRLLHRADFVSGTRTVSLCLTAVPMTAAPEEVATPFLRLLNT